MVRPTWYTKRIHLDTRPRDPLLRVDRIPTEIGQLTNLDGVVMNNNLLRGRYDDQPTECIVRLLLAAAAP